MSIPSIDEFEAIVRSPNIIDSPWTKVPVVCVTTISVAWILPASFAKYPIAPLLKPRTLVPAFLEVSKLDICNIVYVWISQRYKSHSVEFPVYGASDTLNA